MDKPRVPPPHALIGRRIAHIFPLVPRYPGIHDLNQFIPGQAVPHGIIFPVVRHEHDPHLPIPARQRQMNLLGPTAWFESDRFRFCQEMLGPRQRVVIVVLLFRVDFRLRPVEDPELVIGSQVDQRERNGARPGRPSGRGREEDVADEVCVRGVRSFDGESMPDHRIVIGSLDLGMDLELTVMATGDADKDRTRKWKIVARTGITFNGIMISWLLMINLWGDWKCESS
ncbi:hypothetical protein STAS_20666 [Striga asiatica]|uniref:Uncharacterized protein n=1 Tax=Striga asiatica TaxID=4170 RepID=A0A5A7QEU1_STRAF|nr:hypothetical protein STAS_20666 [Striga asiatica]